MYVKGSKSLLKINSDLFYMIPFNWNNQSNWSLWWKKGQSVILQGRAKRQNIVKAVFYRCSILLHYFMYFCWSKYFPWKQQLFSTSFLIDMVNFLNEVHRWFRLKNGSDQLKVKGTFTPRVKGRWWSPASWL